MNKATRKIQSLMIATAFGLVGASGVMAASIANKDSSAQTIVVTEDGNKTDITLGASESINVCGNGCFITFPNGDREALAGDEKIDIVGGRAQFK